MKLWKPLAVMLSVSVAMSGVPAFAVSAAEAVESTEAAAPADASEEVADPNITENLEELSNVLDNFGEAGDPLSPESFKYGKTEASVEGKAYPFIQDYGEEEYENDEFTLYTVEGGDIPYVSVPEYMTLLSEILEKAGRRSGITYEVSQIGENYYMVKRPDTNNYMMINTDRNTLEFDNFNAFTQLADVKASVPMMDLPDPKSIDMTEMNNLFLKLMTLSEEEQLEYIQDFFGSQQEQESLFATSQETINRRGEMISLYLSDYLIDFVEQDGVCYVPLQTLNDLFLGEIYTCMIFNGETLYFIPYESKLANEIDRDVPKEMSQEFALFNYNELRFLLDCFYGLKAEHGISSFGTLLAQNTDLVSDLVSTDSSKFDNAISRLTFTYFDDSHSGLISPSWRSTGMPNIFESMGLASVYKNKLNAKYVEARHNAYPDGMPMYEEVGDMAFVTFDTFYSNDDYSVYYHMDDLTEDQFVIDTTPDLLTELITDNMGEGSGDSTGESSEDAAPESAEEAAPETAEEAAPEAAAEAAPEAAEEAAPETVEDAADAAVEEAATGTEEETGDSAGDSSGDSNSDSSEDSLGEMAQAEEPEPVDTIALLMYAYQQITREDSPVKNVVLDISLNGGGKSDAAIYALVWMLGQANIAVRDTFTGAETIMRLTADLDLDENYTASGKGLVNKGYNIYCLISPNSFSCGNLVPAALKMSEQATLIGRTSGGGSCAVLFCTSASGTMFQISGPRQLTTIRNGSAYNIDQGIDPDVILNKVETFYDREAIVDLIHGLK